MIDQSKGTAKVQLAKLVQMGLLTGTEMTQRQHHQNIPPHKNLARNAQPAGSFNPLEIVLSRRSSGSEPLSGQLD